MKEAFKLHLFKSAVNKFFVSFKIEKLEENKLPHIQSSEANKYK